MFTEGYHRRWRTDRRHVWEVGGAGSGRFITIPAGTEFESSVPQWARWFISPDDKRFLLAALVHDYLLEAGVYERPQAAAEWYDAARAGAAPAFRAKVAYIALAINAVVR